MKRIVLAALGAISLSACAQESKPAQSAQPAAAAPVVATAPGSAKAAAGSPEERAISAIATLNPQVRIDRVGAAPLPGFREAVVSGQVVYVSDDGRYLFLPGSGGALYDTTAKKNLSEAALASTRKQLLETIPAGERIVFAPANPKYTVTIFTDVECGYCRKLHSEIAQINAQGIAVEYLAFPRMGIGSDDYKKMVSVWCASDRKTALTNAKSDRKVPAQTCKTTVDMQYEIGQRVGLTGTPMIVTEDGTQLGGYMAPAAMRAALDEHAGAANTAAADTGAGDGA